ncbi:MAG: SUMF1/EgtB/PvdO family nonheme iron enzyme [Rhodospirillales bacterium]|jgi:formylglycine-generating enzyme required for sulfatase activity|nr:SUMF1/EgtB/PvdO family nonheme iron enzyme [Rhodospirillales bacterium]MDP7215547.1 SUMF1/EgtB/PvdO family nonheme iron enzyme [Rhodospirillales bacterium]HIJ43421.1 SUMF1/EgtB/PvdO family nonheme iron enzyme [Rhodospirillaceae bacterium]HIJ93699.1 SUMF1/EgtB/PvdO family nonheme iron enzyme [Rhodospirillaceae bacterium]HJP54562.1 SUMF1/EgtB/PvdO family nonheme iron enzyme [Rhodospirillales bacterium]
MSDVFISYKREERGQAEEIAKAIASRGYDTWWDVELLPGDKFADEIEAVVRKAKVAIVLWSKASVKSGFVRAEASLALKRGILISARLDDASVPLPFGEHHILDLRNWNGSSEDSILKPLLDAIEKRIGKGQSPAEPADRVDIVLKQPEAEAVYWRSICEKTPQEIKEYEAYLGKYGDDGIIFDLDRLRIEQLQSESNKPWPKILKVVGNATAIAGLLAIVLQIADRFFPVDKQELTVGTVFQDCEGGRVAMAGASPAPDTFCGPKMVVVPPGSFLMGDLSGDGDSDEKPFHGVTIGAKFAAGKLEVTFAEWDACIAAGGCSSYYPDDEGWGRGRRPVINVFWDDIQSYVQWLSGKTGKNYRLLSESEWEYAARAGMGTKWSCGNKEGCLESVAWYAGNGGEKTHPVGEKGANGFGLYDMHGNVWEWVEDCKMKYGSTPADGSAATIPDACNRVYRGSSWYGDSRVLRAANRHENAPDFRNFNLGFRLARTL